jgi:hypothetical protein
MGKAALWTEEMLASLGRKKTCWPSAGASAKTVNLKRNALHLAFGHFQRTQQALALLGQEADAEVARQLASARPAWWPVRTELALYLGDGRCFQQSFGLVRRGVALLGTASDARVAEQLA